MLPVSPYGIFERLTTVLGFGMFSWSIVSWPLTSFNGGVLRTVWEGWMNIAEPFMNLFSNFKGPQRWFRPLCSSKLRIKRICSPASNVVVFGTGFRGGICLNFVV